MPWKKGESGNPKGRAIGSSYSEIARWRAKLSEHLPRVIDLLIKKVEEGDVSAMKLILERTIPTLRSEELPINIDNFSGTRVDLVAAVVEAIAQGKLDTSRGARMIALLSPSELDERAGRVERILEARSDDSDENEG